MNKPTQTIEILSPAKDHYLIKGALTFSTIDKKTPQALNLMQAAAIITIDLVQLDRIDSAGLALLIEWVKIARTSQIELRFKNIPAQLSDLAKLSDIAELELFKHK